MTRKKLSARIGRHIRKATGISFPVAMNLGKLASRMNRSIRPGDGWRYLATLDPEMQAAAKRAVESDAGSGIAFFLLDEEDIRHDQIRVRIWGKRGELSL